MVGSSGAILRTTNGGTTWTYPNSGTYNFLLDVFFIDSQNGWAVGQSGTRLKTTNGGQTWVPKNGSSDYSHQDVHFTDTQNGWTTAIAVINGSIVTRVIRTTNGGTTWTVQNGATGGAPGMNAIHFINSQHGWTIRGVTICGSGGCGTNQEVLVTSNGGQTWSRQFSASTGLSNVQFGRSIFFKDAQHGWAVGSNGGILRYSPDQGSPLTVNITKNAPCFGNNGSATANVSGGNPPYYYIWNTAHFNQTISNLPQEPTQLL